MDEYSQTSLPQEITPQVTPSPMQNYTQPKKSPPFLILIAAILLVGVGIAIGTLMSSQKSSQQLIINPSEIPAPTDISLPLVASNINFEDSFGQINISFESPDKTNINADGSYTVDEQPIREINFHYYPSKDTILPKINYSNDSDGERAGGGCFLGQDKITIANLAFQKQYCYYNPINITKSGVYDKNISSPLGNFCVAFIQRSPEITSALYVNAIAQEGFDSCEFLQNLKNLKIEIQNSK